MHIVSGQIIKAVESIGRFAFDGFIQRIGEISIGSKLNLPIGLVTACCPGDGGTVFSDAAFSHCKLSGLNAGRCFNNGDVIDIGAIGGSALVGGINHDG